MNNYYKLLWLKNMYYYALYGDYTIIKAVKMYNGLYHITIQRNVDSYQFKVQAASSLLDE